MAFAQLIDTKYLFDTTIIPNNVDTNILNPFIREAQVMYIKNVLGTQLYTKLMNDVIAGGSTGKYLELMNNWVAPAQAKWTLWLALPFIWTRISNKSLVKKDSDNSTPVGENEMELLLGRIQSSAEYYCEEVRKFILENSQSFPEYFTNSSFDTKPSNDIYNCGIYTGKGLNDDYRRYNGYYSRK